ncbi:MAG: putative ABC exporter domain-containing protein, partial [Streptococcus sp.]
ILVYGAMIVSLFNVDAGQIMAVNNIDLHMGILLLIGFQAIMLFATLMQSKKALFTGEDAFNLFTGPFTRRQVMSYLTFQTIIQAFLLALISLVFLAAFSGGAGFNFIFIVLAYLASVITVLFSYY